MVQVRSISTTKAVILLSLYDAIFYSIWFGYAGKKCQIGRKKNDHVVNNWATYTHLFILVETALKEEIL